MDGPEVRKQRLRRQFRLKRRLALEQHPGAIVAAATAALPELRVAGRHLGLYWPIGHEPDLRPVADQLTAMANGLLALPAVHGGKLLYRPWRPGQPLLNDGCGIPAPPGPAALAPAELALLLAPALAIDRRGIRLGYGGGWFDRLRSEPHWRSVPALAVAPRACLVERLPADPWDVPFDGWLDEDGVHWLQRV
jgi:5-formyltetrahydrofolate cyclo-ligase